MFNEHVLCMNAPLYTYSGDKHPLIFTANPSSQYPVRKQKPQGRPQGIDKRDANFSHFAYAIIPANMREDILSSDLENKMHDSLTPLPVNR